MRVAAVDIGASSARLLIADVARRDLDMVVTPARRSSTLTSLGQGVGITGALDPIAAGRAVAVLRGYGAAITAAGCDAVTAVADETIGLAAGGEEFLHRVAAVLGTRPSLLSVDQEAALTFDGARSGIAVEGPVLVIDPGPSSVKMIVGKGEPAFVGSLPVGTHGLAERRLSVAPVASGALAAARFDVTEAMLEIDLPENPVSVIGVGETLADLAAVALGADAPRLHGTVLPVETVTSIIGLLAGMAVDEIARLPGVPDDRAGRLLGGAVIVEQVLAVVGVSEVAVSTSGLIDAMARRVASQIG